MIKWDHSALNLSSKSTHVRFRTFQSPQCPLQCVDEHIKELPRERARSGRSPAVAPAFSSSGQAAAKLPNRESPTPPQALRTILPKTPLVEVVCCSSPPASTRFCLAWNTVVPAARVTSFCLRGWISVWGANTLWHGSGFRIFCAI